MKLRKALLSVILAASLVAYFLIPTDAAATIALRYAAAADAFTAKLNQPAEAPESSVSINLKATAGAGQVMVHATIMKHTDPTATSPARHDILSRPSVFSALNNPNPMVFTVPANSGATRVELQFASAIP